MSNNSSNNTDCIIKSSIINKKKLLNYWDVVIRDNINDGCLFFFVTINPEENQSALSLLKKFSNSLICDLNLVNFVYSTIEYNKKNKEHIHSIFAVKSLTGFNDVMLFNINKDYRKSLTLDFVIKPLNNFQDIKKIIKYLIKDLSSELFLKNFIYLERHKLDLFSELTKYLSEYKNIFTINIFEGFAGNISGCKIRHNELSDEVLMNFWNYYLLLNDLYINKNFIFKKIDNTLISFEPVFDKTFLFNEFDKIFLFFLEKFPMHFKNFNLYSLKVNYLIHCKKLLENFDKVTTNKITFTYKILEFTDGIFFLEFGKFIKKEKINKNLNLATLKFYKKKYEHIREPKHWIDQIKITLNSDKVFDDLCCYLGNCIIKNQVVFDKKKTLSITGESNTGKTTLIAKTLINFFGDDNVGFLSANDNFKFQNLISKEIGIFDEFNYKGALSDQYLKLFAWEIFCCDIKYKDSTKITNLPVVLLANKKLKDNDPETQKALINRIYEVSFTKKIVDIDESLVNKKLKSEEAEIILYWVKKLNKRVFEKKNLKLDSTLKELFNEN